MLVCYNKCNFRCMSDSWSDVLYGFDNYSGNNRDCINIM